MSSTQAVKHSRPHLLSSSHRTGKDLACRSRHLDEANVLQLRLPPKDPKNYLGVQPRIESTMLQHQVRLVKTGSDVRHGILRDLSLRSQPKFTQQSLTHARNARNGRLSRMMNRTGITRGKQPRGGTAVLNSNLRLFPATAEGMTDSVTT